MEMQITKAFVEQFGATFEHLYQQLTSRLESYVRRESQHSETESFNQLGLSEPDEVLIYDSDTSHKKTPHDVRTVQLRDYARSEIIDKKAKLRMLVDPASEYLKGFTAGFKRKIDRILIEAATGIALRSEGPRKPLVPTPLPAAQIIAANYVASGPVVNSGLTLAKLIKAKSILGKAEALGSGSEGQAILVYTQQQLDDLLLNVQQVSSADFANVRALVHGEVDHFMGFKFVKTELVTKDTSTNIRNCFAFVQNALLLSEGQGIQWKIDELPTKHYATQAYVSMSMGATRMQEAGVVSVMCEEP